MPSPSASPIQFAAIAVLAVLAVLIVVALIAVLKPCGGRGRFASRRAHEVHDKAQDLFQKSNGDATYTAYRGAVVGADPVQYSDVRALYRSGQLTPQAVEDAL